MQNVLDKNSKLTVKETSSEINFLADINLRGIVAQATLQSICTGGSGEGGINTAITLNRVVEDFCQGGIGDCWYLASIKSLSMSELGRQSIYNAINFDSTNASLSFVGAAGFTYNTTLDAITQEANDGDTYTSEGHSCGDADTLLFEMALKEYVSNSAYKNSYFRSSYDGGYMNEALSLLTGKASTTYTNGGNDLAAMSEKLDELAQIIDHTAITAGCQYEANPSLDIPAANHAYSVIGIDPINKMVSFRNPWYSETELKQISYADFSYYFRRIDYVDLFSNNQYIFASNLGVTINTGSGNDLIYGGTGNDTINGGAGIDTMVGGKGDDTYYVDNIRDTIWEYAQEGIDTVVSSFSYSTKANIENLILTGTSEIYGMGNYLDNYLVGNSAANFLSGDIGNDTIYGQGGNDIILGGSGNDILDGGIGADTMQGGRDDDTYYVDNTQDIVNEDANEGSDAIYSSVTYTLSANIENLTLTGTTTISGTGNELNNTINGNSGNNILNGNDGNDTLIGGAGNDILDGGVGADFLAGGVGNDIFYVDNIGDVVSENINSGTDKVYSSITYTLAQNVENLTLNSTSVINGTGNDLDNYIIGNSAVNILLGGSGNDTLDGGLGADTTIGGIGDDTYYVSNYIDIVIENANEGNDNIYSTVTYTLSSNVENLILTGTVNMNGTGNNLDNVITGNSAANTLTGIEGNDTLIGNNGNDTLKAGIGNDTYMFNAGDGNDIISDSAGLDIVKFGSNVLKQSVAFFKQGVDLIVGYSNGDRITIQGQSNTGTAIEKLQLSSEEFLTNNDINLLIQQMSSYAAANGIQLNSIDNVLANQDLMAIVSNSWQTA